MNTENKKPAGGNTLNPPVTPGTPTPSPSMGTAFKKPNSTSENNAFKKPNNPNPNNMFKKNNIPAKPHASNPPKPQIFNAPANNSGALHKTNNATPPLNNSTEAGFTKKPGIFNKAFAKTNPLAPKSNADKIRIIPLGGLDEVGKNMTIIESENDMIIVDCGLAFPSPDLLGVDLVVPDISYVKKNVHKLRAIIITHGHEDHIGSIPIIMRQINPPIYCTKFAEGLIMRKLTEHRMDKQVKIKCVNMGSRFNIASFGIEFIRTNHSIPDTSAIAITTSIGTIVHSGDFKIDSSPVYGPIMDLGRFAAIGASGVLALLSDSTNAEKPGFSGSEKLAGAGLEEEFVHCNKRIIIATFASNVFRVQQILDIANKHGRKVALSGRSMENTIEVATRLGFLTVPKDVLVDIAVSNKLPKNKVVVITTGSQGEPMSALNRMSNGTHKQLQVGIGDKVILSATPIPGNEKSVYSMINELGKKGVDIMHGKKYHVSGHAYAEEQKILLSLLRPKYFMPVHGEHSHLKAHGALAEQTGVNPKNIFISTVGRPLELTKTTAKFAPMVPFGNVYVDGNGGSTVGTAVLRDRTTLSKDGLIIVNITLSSSLGELLSGPDIVSRGFVYVKEADELIRSIRFIARKSIDKCLENNIRDWGTIKTNIRSEVSDYIYKKTRRNPMILPIITEV